MTRTLRSTQLWTAFVLVVGYLGVFAAPAAQAWVPGQNGLIAFDYIPIGCGFGCSHPALTLFTVPASGMGAASGVAINAFDPAWSPDGQRLAFVQGDPDNDPNHNDVVIAAPDGTHRQVVAANVGDAPEIRSPAWSPDGQSIAYVAQDSTDQMSGSSIWRVYRDHGVWGPPRRLLDSAAENIGRIVFSPDGTQLAFAAGEVSAFLGDYGVYVLPAGGGPTRELVSQGGGAFHGFLLTNHLDWGPGGIDFVLAPGQMTVEDPSSGARLMFLTPGLTGYALAPFQGTGATIPGEFAGVFGSDNSLHTFTREGSLAQLTFGGVLSGNVAWQTCGENGTIEVGYCLPPSAQRLRGYLGSTTPYLSGDPTRLWAALGCSRYPWCQLIMDAWSGNRLLGQARARLRRGEVQDVSIRFDRVAGALLRSGAVRKISLRVRLAGSRKVLARRTIPVGEPSSISAGCPTAASLGTNAQINGKLSLPSSGSSTLLLYATSDLGMRRRMTVRTDSRGHFTAGLGISGQGSWSVYVIWPGTKTVVPAIFHCAINVPPPAMPVPSKLTLACPAQGAAGSPITVSGTLAPASKGAQIKISYTDSGGTSLVDTVSTDASGQFSDSRTFSSPTQLQTVAAIGGSFEYQASSSSPCATTIQAPPPPPPPPPPAATSLTLACPAMASIKDGSFSVTGAITPAFAGASIQIIYTPSKGSSITHTTTTDSSGDYSDSVTITQAQTGNWTTQTSYLGDGQHQPSTSPPCTTGVS